MFIFFSFRSSLCWIENDHSFFIPVKFFHCFFIPVFSRFFASKMILGPWELPPESVSRTLFVSFHFVSFLYCFCYLSFLCLENCPWKLSKGTFFSNPFRFVFFRLAMFPPLHSKLTLEIVKRRFSSNPFRFVFVLFFHVCFRFFPFFFSFPFSCSLVFSVSFFISFFI